MVRDVGVTLGDMCLRDFSLGLWLVSLDLEDLIWVRFGRVWGAICISELRPTRRDPLGAIIEMWLLPWSWAFQKEFTRLTISKPSLMLHILVEWTWHSWRNPYFWRWTLSIIAFAHQLPKHWAATTDQLNLSCKIFRATLQLSFTLLEILGAVVFPLHILWDNS